MEKRYTLHRYKSRKAPLSLILVLSATLHGLLFFGLFAQSVWMPTPPPPTMIEIEIFKEASSTVVSKEVSTKDPAVTPPKPPPPPPPSPPKEEPKKEEPKKEEPKKEEPKKEEPKPEPEKEEPKKEEPKKEAKGACCLPDGKCMETTIGDCGKRGGLYQGDNVTCKTANCPKPDPKKKEAKKEEPKKTEPKKETPEKTKPKETPRDSEEELLMATAAPITSSEPPKPIAPMGPDQSDMLSVNNLPPGLMSWGALVKRKVELVWIPPQGVELMEDETVAEVSFWVDAQGNLVGRPEVVKEASDPAVSASGITAIMLAQPYPPLPEAYGLTERQILYEFKLSK